MLSRQYTIPLAGIPATEATSPCADGSSENRLERAGAEKAI